MERAALRRVFPVGLVALLAAVLIVALAVWATGEGARDQVVPEAPVMEAAPMTPGRPLQDPARPPHERPPAHVGPQALSDAYEACATRSGFAPGGVQVLVAGGTPVWVKSGRDVPAAVHRPCFTLIGGTDPQQSSWGTPSP